MKKPTVERVQLGKAYHYCDGKAYRVGLLNECRARLDPLFRKRRTITSRLHGVTVTIHATARITGDVTYDNLTIEQGSQVDGRFSHRRAGTGA